MDTNPHKQTRLWSTVSIALLVLRHVLFLKYPGLAPSAVGHTGDSAARFLAVIFSYFAEAVASAILLGMPFHLLQTFRSPANFEDLAPAAIDLSFIAAMYVTAFFLLFPLN